MKKYFKFALEFFFTMVLTCLLFWSLKPAYIVGIVYFLIWKNTKNLKSNIRNYVGSEIFKPRISELENDPLRFQGYDNEIMQVHELININNSNKHSIIINDLFKVLTFEDFAGTKHPYKEQVFVKAILDEETKGMYYLIYSEVNGVMGEDHIKDMSFLKGTKKTASMNEEELIEHLKGKKPSEIYPHEDFRDSVEAFVKQISKDDA